MPSQPTIGLLAYIALFVALCGCNGKVPSFAPRPSGAAPGAKQTVIDLSDQWTPYLFSESFDPSTVKIPNDFRSVFIALANEQPVVSPHEKAAEKAFFSLLSRKGRARFLSTPMVPAPHRFLEVYGIPPSLSVLRTRARSEVGEKCFQLIDYQKISAFLGFITYKSNDDARERAAEGRRLTDMLKSEMVTRGFATLLEYRANMADENKKKEIDAAVAYEAIREAQRQLMCEGLLENASENVVDGGLCYKTHLALLLFEQKNRIFGWGYFGGETLDALKKTPEERLYAALVRVITERTVDAAGIIEDGTATRNGRSAVYRDAGSRLQPVRNLTAEFSRAVMEQMHIATPAEGIAFLREADANQFKDYKVHVALPSLPPYYSDKMALGIEIDRGDVYYDYPYEDGEKKYQPRENTPVLTLYVTFKQQKIPLAVMKTSIGGWQDEMAGDGYLYLKYKNSDAGRGIIGEIIAAPTWIPPESTPPGEIVKRVTVRGRSITVPDEDVIGPWYTSAYGLVAAVHLKQASVKTGETGGADVDIRGTDVGIRSHGSYDYTSILRRYSHGCHRLYNHLAVRLYDFILRRSPHRRIGRRPTEEVRRFEQGGVNYKIEVHTDGYVFELKNPIRVDTLEGHILGARKTPIPHYMPKPGVLYGPDAAFLMR